MKKGIFLGMVVIICMLIWIIWVIPPDQQIQKIEYTDLPIEVKNEFFDVFNDITNSEVFLFCKNLDSNCNCSTTTKYKLLSTILDQKVIVKSCNKKFHISFENLPRIYIIKGDTLYCPIGNSYVIEDGQPLSSVIHYQSLNYLKVW